MACANAAKGAEDSAFVSAAVTEGRDRLTTIFDDIESLATDGPEDLATAFQRRAAEETEALVDDLRSRGQRPSSSGMAEAMRRLEGLQADFGVEAAVFENNARVGRLARGLDDTLSAAQARAFSHPEQLHGLLDDMERTAARLAPHLDTDAVEAFRKGAPERVTTAALTGLMALDPAGARDGLEAGDFDDLLGDDMKGALSRQAAAEAGLAETRQAARQALERQDAGRDLAAAIAAGGKGFADVAQALNGGIIDESQARRLDGLLEARLKADKRLAEALAGEDALDAADPGQRRAFDRYYRDVFRPRLEGLAEPDVQHALTDLFRRARMVPDAMTRELRAGILSGDPDREAVAAGRLATLQCHHPHLLPQPHRPPAGPEPFDTIPADEQARAHAIAGFANLGLAPAHAVRLADQKLERHDIIELAPQPGWPDDIHCQDPDPGFHRPLPETDDDLLPIEVSGRDQRPRPAAAPPGFVWENGAWRRETPQEAAQRRANSLFAGIGSAPGATGGDGQGHDGGHDGGFHLLAAEGAAGGGGSDGGDASGADGGKPAMTGPGGEGKPDEKPQPGGNAKGPDAEAPDKDGAGDDRKDAGSEDPADTIIEAERQRLRDKVSKLQEYTTIDADLLEKAGHEGVAALASVMDFRSLTTQREKDQVMKQIHDLGKQGHGKLAFQLRGMAAVGGFVNPVMERATMSPSDLKKAIKRNKAAADFLESATTILGAARKVPTPVGLSIDAFKVIGVGIRRTNKELRDLLKVKQPK